MATSKLKNVFEKLTFLKSYSSLVLPIIIAFVGTLLFIPAQLMSGKLKKQITSNSISTGLNAESIIENVPSKDQWKEEQRYQDFYKQDADRISRISKEAAQRQLLSYKVFPKPQDSSQSIFLEFSQLYCSSIENLLSDLSARDCPTEAELKRLTASGRQMAPQINSEIKGIICKDIAQAMPLYANPSHFTGYNFWQVYEYTGTKQAVNDCWYWQLGYWIIEDVVDTVKILNSGSKSVFTSPVKRIMYVRFSMEDSFGLSSSSRSQRGSKESKPKYINSVSEGLTDTFTGRSSNAEFDIVHFNFSVIVSSKTIPAFMRELCSSREHKFKGWSGTEQEQSYIHNQMTILESIISPVDQRDPKHELYCYGEDAAMQLDLVCEYIFDKSGYEPIKPEVVKEELKKKKSPGLL